MAASVMNTLINPSIIAGLQADIQRLQGFRAIGRSALDWKLGPLQEAFPTGSFPLGAVHEFFTGKKEDQAASTGFIAGLLSALIGDNGTILWISSLRTLFPPALIHFGI